MPDIDAVYTWVDGTDPAFRAAYEHHAPGGTAAAEVSRYRDNDELRYSLRSLVRNAPWIRRVHLLTNGQVPRWLDRSHPRVHLVTHAEVFPDPACLPTFNSNAIEMCLHRIPGLSRRFLYFNDDVFLGRPVTPADFFPEEGGQWLFAQATRLPTDRWGGSARDRALAYTQTVVDGLVARAGGTDAGAGDAGRALIAATATSIGLEPEDRLLPAHSPQPYDRDILAALERLLPDDFRNTASHRVRSGDDLVLAAAYIYGLLEAPELLGASGRAEAPGPRPPAGEAGAGPARLRLLQALTEDYTFVMVERNYRGTLRGLADIALRHPRFFCINDDMVDASAGHPLLRIMRGLLRAYFRRPSPFEDRGAPPSR